MYRCHVYVTQSEKDAERLKLAVFKALQMGFDRVRHHTLSYHALSYHA